MHVQDLVLIRMHLLQEISSGNVSFSVFADTSAVTVSNFQFTEGGECERHIPREDCLRRNAKTFTVAYTGSGSAAAEITVIGRGEGNFDGFRGQLSLRLLPGLKVTPDRVVLQPFPGSVLITFGPDTPPNRETFVDVHVLTDFGSDAALMSYEEPILLVPKQLVMPQGLLSTQVFRMTNGGAEGNRLRNRVSGKAIVTFSVNDPGNVYHGTGIIGSAKSIEVDVLPGFSSNVQDTFEREVQRETKFVLTLLLDEPTVQDINVTATSSNPNAAAVTVSTVEDTARIATALVRAGSKGPLYVGVEHVNQGTSFISLKVLTPGGNYGAVDIVDYLKVRLMPGFITSVTDIKLQAFARAAVFSIGLDTRPTADVELVIATTDPAVITATPSLYFYAAQWYEGYTQTVEVVWRSPGAVQVTFTASSPGGNYNRASCCSVSVKAFRPLTISQDSILVQRGGQAFVAVSPPTQPAKLTTMTLSSFPPGVVNMSLPYTILPGTNDTEIITLSHLSRGSATVRISASAPGDAYDGVETEIHVTAMPGFLFSRALVELYSCPRSVKCVAELQFGPEVVPTADVHVTITASDSKVVSIQPTEFTFLASEGMVNKSMTLTMGTPGISCLSFAATSRGNYDKVSSGGVTVVSYPDFHVSDLTIHPRNAPEWGPHPLSDYNPEEPVVFVQNLSYSTIMISPKELPTADTVVLIENPRPDLVEAPESILFQKDSIEPVLVRIMHVGTPDGQVRLSLLGQGKYTRSNYGGARWEQGILVRAVPALVAVPDYQVTVLYHFERNITIRPSVPLEGDHYLLTTAQDPSLVQILTPSVLLTPGHTNGVEILIKHIDPGFTRLRLTAVSATPESSNYHNSELIVVLTLNYPGFEVDTRDCVWGGAAGCSPTVLHVQRWQGKALNGDADSRGIARMYFTPNEVPDSVTNVNLDSSDDGKILIQSQDRVNDPNEENDPYRNSWPTGNSETKFFQGTHQGQVGAVTLRFSTPQSATKWPEATGCEDSEFRCPASSDRQAVYFGIVMPIPDVTVIAHAGFKAEPELVYVQRQNYVVARMSLDSVPAGDTTIYLRSSDPSIASVSSEVLFLRGEDTSSRWRNITITNNRPGRAYISFRSKSSEIDYDGAEADNAITVECQQGFQLSSLLILIQARPTEEGLAVLTITPDLPPTHDVNMTITSSDVGQAAVLTPSVRFRANSVDTKNVTLSHVASGSIKMPVELTLELDTHQSSNYFFVVAPKVTVVALGSFVLSSTTITVQKGRQHEITVGPNVPPDQVTQMQAHTHSRTLTQSRCAVDVVHE